MPIAARHAGFLAVALIEAASAPALAAESLTVAAVPAAERQRLSLSPVYTQYVRAAGGTPVVASERVQPEALAEAAWLIDRLLAKRPDVAAAIGRSPVRFVVMAHGERTTDVPEHSDLEPRDYWDRRARGLGATLARPATSCGEENLLCFAGDPYAAENILIHEFADTIHQIGLAQVDPSFEPRLRAAFAEAERADRWKGTYARENPAEYWAEGVQSWFSCNRTHDREHGDVNTPAALAEHDPPLAALLTEVFGDTPWEYTRPHNRDTADQRHLGEFNRDRAPRFDWATHHRAATAMP